ncbi:MAG TPA: hypothetical protein VG167_22450 [Verrucomicrobiae bacterium]|nr:hypothetical protein [Verrucomicrobiae bacterium]
MDQSKDNFFSFLATNTPAGLTGAARPEVESESALREKLAATLRHSALPQAQRELVLALILLWHDHLEPAHAIAQSIENADGAFVHGIMHRREPDYANAKYWFRRVGEHPAFKEIARRVNGLPKPAGADAFPRLTKGARWDPFAMVDACETAAGRPPSDPFHQFLLEAQRIETEVLLGLFTAA